MTEREDHEPATAARLGELLAAFTGQPRRSLDAIAVFRDLSQAAGSIAGAAAELHRQEWFDLDDDEARAAWDAALAGLRAAEGTFVWAADGACDSGTSAEAWATVRPWSSSVTTALTGAVGTTAASTVHWTLT